MKFSLGVDCRPSTSSPLRGSPSKRGFPNNADLELQPAHSEANRAISKPGDAVEESQGSTTDVTLLLKVRTAFRARFRSNEEDPEQRVVVKVFGIEAVKRMENMQKALVQAGLWQRFFEPLSIRSMDPGPQGQLTKLVMFRDVGKGLVTLERAASALRRTKDGTIKVAKDLLKVVDRLHHCASLVHRGLNPQSVLINLELQARCATRIRFIVSSCQRIGSLKNQPTPYDSSQGNLRLVLCR
mmetsp:Transcript_64552/g.172992  ORF Transcript_64552/g.172992 Transcript_64552/m.172992 type:complete len:241 (+) Transcript_64552:542-1264(+)